MGNIEKFDSMADVYDTPERRAVAEIIAREIAKHAPNMTSKTAIDYGCGTGLVGLQLLDVFGEIIFVDAAQNMVEQVARKISAGGFKNARSLCLDLESAAASPLRADCIFMSQTLLHIKEIDQVLTSLCALLNPHGRLLIVDFDKHHDISSPDVHNGFEHEWLIAKVKQIGFASASAHTFHHGKNMFMGKDASLFLLDAAK